MCSRKNGSAFEQKLVASRVCAIIHFEQPGLDVMNRLAENNYAFQTAERWNNSPTSLCGHANDTARNASEAAGTPKMLIRTGARLSRTDRRL
jgi:hypothetical protein